MSDDTITSLDQLAGALAAEDEGQPNAEPEAQNDEQQPAGEGQPDGEAQAQESEQSGDEAAAEQQEQPDDGTPADPVIKWTTASGESFEVPQSELQAGYMRTADYTQKTQQLAEQRKAVEQAATQKMQEAEQYAADLAQLHSVAAQLKQFEGLDWATLEQQDPSQAASLWRQYQQLRDSGQSLMAGYQQKRQAADAQRAQQFQQATTEALEHLRKVIPNFSDSTLRDMREYGIQAGFSAEELSMVADKRQMEVLWKAQQWDALQAKKPEVQNRIKQVPPKATKPGTATAPPTKVEQAQRQLKQRKDVRSLAAYILASGM